MTDFPHAFRTVLHGNLRQKQRDFIGHPKDVLPSEKMISFFINENIGKKGT